MSSPCKKPMSWPRKNDPAERPAIASIAHVKSNGTGVFLFSRLLAVCALATVAWCQTDRANITGTVTDQSGAVVPGAKVKAIHLATNTERNTVSSTQGDFTIAQLSVGDYRVEFEAPGFKGLVRNKITLTPGITARIDAALTVGQVSESVAVSADAPLLQTDSSKVSTAVTPKFVQDLPLVVAGQPLAIGSGPGGARDQE